MIHAVILDMDGLLIDSEPLWNMAMVETLSALGVPITPQNAHATMGLRVDQSVEYWYRKFPWQGSTIAEVTDSVVARVTELIKQQGKPREGVNELIALFRAKSLPTAVASSSPTPVINAVMDKLNIRQDLAALVSAETEEHGKPHPAVFLTTAQKLGVHPEDCLVFEDSPNGVIAAKAARMHCVAVPYEGLVGDRRFEIADLVIPTLSAFTAESLARWLTP